MTEQWRAIDGYPDYEVSDLGRVRRITARTCARAGQVLSTRGLRAGYPSLDLCRDGRRKTHLVHRLVAAAFISPAKPGEEVNHVNGDKMDARAANLEYVTSSENQRHAYSRGLQSAAGEKNGRAKLTWDDVRRIRELAAEPIPPSDSQIAQRFGISTANVRAIVQGKSWSQQRDVAVSA